VVIRAIGYISLDLKWLGKYGLEVIGVRFKGVKGYEPYRLGL
jgi:hypothetical protein